METKQIIIWNNSDDGETQQILDELPKDRFTVTSCGRNIGVNAYSRAFRLATQPYLIELDDDVINAPADWDLRLLTGFKSLRGAGFLAADMIDDKNSSSAFLRWHTDISQYRSEIINGHTYNWGPTGGWCSLTSRKVYDEVGGFRERPILKFFHEDGDFIRRVSKAGYRFAIYGDVVVHHASGPFYTKDPTVDKEKRRYYAIRDRVISLRKVLRSFLISIPLIGERLFSRRA